MWNKIYSAGHMMALYGFAAKSTRGNSIHTIWLKPVTQPPHTVLIIPRYNKCVGLLQQALT